MNHLVCVILAAFSLNAAAENIQYYVSDTNLQCDRGDFKLQLRFDGTGDNVIYVWNGSEGKSVVTWKKDQATFDFNGAVNGPFTFNFRDQTFYFLDVPCKEIQD